MSKRGKRDYIIFVPRHACSSNSPKRLETKYTATLDAAFIPCSPSLTVSNKTITGASSASLSLSVSASGSSPPGGAFFPCRSGEQQQGSDQAGTEVGDKHSHSSGEYLNPRAFHKPQTKVLPAFPPWVMGSPYSSCRVCDAGHQLLPSCCSPAA